MQLVLYVVIYCKENDNKKYLCHCFTIVCVRGGDNKRAAIYLYNSCF